MDGEVKVVVEKLVTFLDGDGLIVASNEVQKMRVVFGSEEWVEVPGLKAQDRRKVNREMKVVEGLMHNLVGRKK